MQYDLFISHSSADAKAALALVDEIESRGVLKCWVAPRDIPIGASYQREIVRAIRNCGGFVLLLSGNANQSDHVLRELELAAEAKKAIYPVKIDETEPAEGIKYYLASTQWVERKALGNQLVEKIEQLVASARGVEQPPARPAPPARSRARVSPMLIGIAAILCLLLGGGVVAWQADWFGIEAAKRARIATEEQVRKDQERQQEELRKQALAQKEKEEQEKRIALQKEEEEKEKARIKKEEEEKEKQRLASIQPVNLPAGTTADITIQKSAPTVGDAVAGKTFFRECDICPVMAVAPAGSNLIGSPAHESGRSNNEGPQQPVAFRVPLAVGRSEISFDEYIACVNEGGCPPGIPNDSEWGYGKQPAMNVSWNDAKAYVGWLSRKTRATYRLLSEAEWEYAARGCAKICESLPFWFGIEISKGRVNYDSRIAYLGSPRATRLNRTVPVDIAEANPFGLLHVHGNVAEWVEDCWQETLEGLPRDGLARTGGDCSRRVIRGGSYSDEPKDVRSAKRSWQAATDRRSQIGFRVARELKL